MRDAPLLIVWMIVCFAAAALGGWVTGSSVTTWYRTLQRPPLAPPDWVFGPVWTALYLAMSVAAWRVGRRRREQSTGPATAWFFVQLALNVAWSAIFFGLKSPGAAAIEIVLLWSAIVATIAAFRRIDRTAAVLMTPYLAWVSFASYLNVAFWWLNR